MIPALIIRWYEESIKGSRVKDIDLLVSGKIEADDYQVIKSESEEKIRRLEVKLTGQFRWIAYEKMNMIFAYYSL